MTNQPRPQKRLQLIHLDLIGKADEPGWAERIRRYLELSWGRAPAQRPHDNHRGHLRLI
jgi:hypothetical protein